MSVLRQANLLGQQRLDVPHLKALESSICGDFDLLAGKTLAGGAPLVVRGFSIVSAGASTADQLQLRVADAIALHYYASESGSVFNVPPDRADELLNGTNPRLVGSFTPSSTNYVGIDFVRVVDDASADVVMFLDESGEETPKTVPLSRVIDYRIVVSTRDFHSLQGVCPIAKVVTGSGNQIVSISDHRNQMFRLGSGGTSANPLNVFRWAEGRTETSGAFIGGDKSITSLKGWMDSVMTRIWESCGGEYWYSPTADRNVRLVHVGAPLVSTGEHFEWTGAHLYWTGLRVVFDNSTAYYNDVANQLSSSVGRTDLVDGECIYVDIDRAVNKTGGSAIVAQKAPLKTLGVGAIPGSRYVLAWRLGTSIYTRDQSFAVGSSFKIATTAVNGTVRLSATPLSPTAPKVATETSSMIMGMAGFSRQGTGTTGNLVIGQGSSAGDDTIILQTTTSSRTVQVKGGQQYSLNQKAALDVVQQGPVGNPLDSRIAQFKAYPNSITETTSVFIEADAAVGLAPVTVLPQAPNPTPTDPARIKYFARPSLFWRTACRLATTSALAANTASGSGPLHTLTANANGALTIDGVAVATNDRVLIKNQNNSNNGIDVVTNPGSGGSQWILTRAADCAYSSHVHKDVAVKVTAGNTNGETAWAMTPNDSLLTPYSVHVPFVMETDVMVWAITSTLTRDQLAIMWFDGSQTIISSGPPYFV